MTVTVALLVPLAISVRAREQAEFETRALIQAQTVASDISDRFHPKRQKQGIAEAAAEAGGGRVIILDEDGIVLADSAGVAIDENYATRQRPEISTALNGDAQTIVRHSDTLGIDIMATAVPILEDVTVTGAVRVTLPMDEVTREVRRTLIGLTAIGASGLIAGLLIAFFFARSLSRPLQRVASTAERLGAGDLTARTGKVRGPYEIEEVATEFDEMAERLEATVKAQREFAGNASHQLRTPLTGLRLRLESAAEDAPPDLRGELEAAQDEVDRLSAIVDRLLVLARKRESDVGRPVPLHDAADRAVKRWRPKARETGAAIEAGGDGAFALADASDIDQILDTLIDNGLSHAPGEPITIESGRINGRAYVAVEDHGPGISPLDRERVFERFYRGGGARPGGSGLGLAIVRELAERWGGSVEIGTSHEGGTRIEVRLPAPDGS